MVLEAPEFRRTMKNYILLFIVLFICSCSVKKNVSAAGIKKYSAKKVLRNANKSIKNFKNLQTKARVTIINKGKDKLFKICRYSKRHFRKNKVDH